MKALVKTLAIVLLSSAGVLAQISEGGTPLSSLKKYTLKEKTSIPVITLPKVNTTKLLLEDSNARKDSNKPKPFRYAEMLSVDINLSNSGVWETLSNGDKLWRVSIHSKDAFSLGIEFNRYYLPPGARLFIYSTDKSHVLGAFTNKNNKKTNKLAISAAKGDSITIEYFEPINVDFPGVLSINKIAHDYKNIFKMLKSGACNIDVNCPEGDDWQDEKRSVCKITFSGYMCSGALINNTSKDETPYFLTANHCVEDQGDATSTIFYFNYEYATCGGVIIPTSETVSGSTLIATPAPDILDFTLLEMSSAPPDTFNVYYAGWNKGTTPATETTCIHHPQGDLKKITYNDDPVTTDSYYYDADSHWLVADWESGTTEGGSSGSPLFDQNHQIVGDLTGGDANCSNNVNDYYAKFSRSWEDYPSKDEQLKYWLDPCLSGVDTLSGYDPNVPDGDNNVWLLEVINPVDTFHNVSDTLPRVILKNKGNENLTTLNIYFQVDEDSVTLTEWTGDLAFNETDTATLSSLSLSSGTHTFKVYSSSPNGETDENPCNDIIYSSYLAWFDFDAGVSVIRGPESEFCNQDRFTPQIEIMNYGSVALTTLSVSYMINDGGIETLPWTGNLDSLESDMVSFPDTTMDNGFHVFTAFISDPNGSSDMSSTNDTLKKKFSMKTGEEVRFILQTDNSGDQTGWSLINSQLSTISLGYNYPNNLYTSRNYCLEEECYEFTIYDNAGDGITGYALVNLTSLDTIVKGGDFGFGESTEFCVPMLLIDYTADTLSITHGESINFQNLSIVDNATVTYSWVFENGTPATSSDRDIRVTYNADGIFDVSLTITDGIHILTDSRTNYVTVLRPPLGINDELNSSIRVYPIPSNDGSVQIKSESIIINAYEVYDILGQKIIAGDEPSYNLTINIERQGIYILKLSTDSGELFKKLIISQ